MTDRQSPADRRVSRRHLLLGGAAAGLGAAGALGIATIAGTPAPTDAGASMDPRTDTGVGALNGDHSIPFYGEHQAGIEVIPQAHIAYLALALHAETDRDALRRMMRVLSDDAARLSQGAAALADSEPELAEVPARLTITFGFGPELVRRANGEAPGWLRPLPAFAVDRLEERYSGGDLLLAVATDDPTALAHALRVLTRDSRSFATVKWTQHGFRRASGSEKPGTTMRNLFGQKDGTVNPQATDADFAELVWGAASHPAWLTGGTSFVLRRIVMHLDKWDRLDRSGREKSVGRSLSTGAPLTGTHEHDEPDFAATTPIGFPVIADYAHLRRARTSNRAARIHRRGYNFEDFPTGSGEPVSGLLFGSYQADVDAQFVPIQQRLDQLDLLNEWTTPVGSAIFAIPPGCQPGGFIGETLLG